MKIGHTAVCSKFIYDLDESKVYMDLSFFSWKINTKYVYEYVFAYEIQYGTCKLIKLWNSESYFSHHRSYKEIFFLKYINQKVQGKSKQIVSESNTLSASRAKIEENKRKQVSVSNKYYWHLLNLKQKWFYWYDLSMHSFIFG